MPMTDANLDLIEARAAAATAGPWGIEVDPDEVKVGTYSGRAADPYDGGLPLVDEVLFVADRRLRTTLGDLHFIAAARADVPALVAEVRRLRQLLLKEETP